MGAKQSPVGWIELPVLIAAEIGWSVKFTALCVVGGMLVIGWRTFGNGGWLPPSAAEG